MELKGFCEVQKKEYSIYVETIQSSALEDVERNNRLAGRICCENASIYNCDGRDCSILKQHNIKR